MMTDRQIRARVITVMACLMAGGVAFSQGYRDIGILAMSFGTSMAAFTAIRLKLASGRTSPRK